MLTVLLVAGSLAMSQQQNAGDTTRATLQRVVDAYSKAGKFNGTILVSKGGEVLYAGASGFRDAEKKIPHDRESIFQVGSLTKQFTAAIIMQLVGEQKLSLSDPLSKYFNGFRHGDKITIKHLLTHTSGIFNYTNDTTLMQSDVSGHYSKEQMLDLIRGYAPDFDPGARFNYSNSGYFILGYIVEKATGKSYEHNVRERILQPLEMNNSGFDFSRLKSPKKASGYFSLQPVIAAPIVDSTIAYSAGALYSTVEDLYKWERAIHTDRILSAQAWQEVFTPFKNGYGFGWGIDSLHNKLITAHAGGIHGFSSYLIRFPSESVAVIAIDNASSTSLSRLARTLAAAVLGEPFELPEAKPEVKVSPDVLKQYVGVYQLAPTFAITIRLDGRQLKLQATNQPEFDLFAESQNKFFLKVVEAKVEFLKGDDGSVNRMVLYQNGLEIPGKKVKE